MAWAQWVTVVAAVDRPGELARIADCPPAALQKVNPMPNDCCETCFYSRPIGSDVAVACHRHPPSITSVEGLRVTSHFPLLNKTEWCGEWRPKLENYQ